MSRTLSAASSLELLRAEAKRLRKAVMAGDPEALARFRHSVAAPTDAPSLRQVQHAVAREYGFASWAALKQELEDRSRSVEARVRLLLDKSVNRYHTHPETGKWGDYERDGPARGAVAARLLARHPELARDSLHTAVVAHDADAVRRWLHRNPRSVDERSAFDGWTPLLRLAYARLPLGPGAASALAIATLLLEAGADPNAGWSDGANDFNVLVGVIGGGESGQAAHPQAEALVRLLIERGADPFVPQALYNTSLGADSVFWLELLWRASAARGETGKWTGPAPPSLGGDGCPSALAYLLGNAVPRHPERTRWLLEHGADARGVNFYSREPVMKYAALAADRAMIELLARHGAPLAQLSGFEQFIAAVTAGDLATLRALAQDHPEYLEQPQVLHVPIHQGRVDVLAALLDLGMSADVAGAGNFRALHVAADHGTVPIARLLIERGATVDAVEQGRGSTPLTRALFFGHAELVNFLVPRSANIRGLCKAGAVERLQQLLTEDPGRARLEERPGEPPLLCLPADDALAAEVVELLLAFGADPNVRNAAGQTPMEVASSRGLDEAAALLGDAIKPAPPSPTG